MQLRIFFCQLLKKIDQFSLYSFFNTATVGIKPNNAIATMADKSFGDWTSNCMAIFQTRHAWSGFSSTLYESVSHGKHNKRMIYCTIALWSWWTIPQGLSSPQTKTTKFMNWRWKAIRLCPSLYCQPRLGICTRNHAFICSKGLPSPRNARNLITYSSYQIWLTHFEWVLFNTPSKTFVTLRYAR